MMVGHYAAALIPYSCLRTYPFWLLLICANIPEFLWLLLAFAGVEAPTPSSLLDATFQNLDVHMTYSHNLIPGIIQGVIVGGAVYAWFRKKEIALWCAFLTVFHVLSDAVVGFEHQLLTSDSMTTSLNTYRNMPHVAILMELAFSVACVYWFDRSERRRGRNLSKWQRIALYAVFVAGVAIWFPSATIPLREQLGL